MKKILIIILTFLLTISFSFTEPILAGDFPAEFNELTDFDEFLIDDTDGESGAFTFNKTSGDNWKIDGSEEPEGDKYLLAGNQDDAEGWFNYTAGVKLGYYVKAQAFLTASSVCSNTQYTTFFNWYNSSENITVKFKWYSEDYYWGSGSNDHTTRLYYMNSAESWVEIYEAYRQPSFYIYTFSWQYYTDNILQYRVYDDDWELLAIENATALIGGDEYTGEDQFNCSNMTFNTNYYESCSEGSGWFRAYEYGFIEEELDLPDYFYPDSDLGARCTNYNPSQGASYSQLFEIDAQGCEPDFWCMLHHVIFYGINIDMIIDDCVDCEWDMIPVRYFEHKTEAYYDETIRHVLLPVSNDQLIQVSDNPDDYELIIDSEYIGKADYIVPYDMGYGIIWENVNYNTSEGDGHPVFGFYSSQHTEGFSQDWYWYGV